MSTYASAIAAMEAELQALDHRRATVLAGLGSLRTLAAKPLPPRASTPIAPPAISTRAQAILDKLAGYTTPVAPGRLAQALGYNSSTALRHHMKPLIEARRVIETGRSAGLRYALPAPVALPPAVAPPLKPTVVGAKAAPEPELDLVTVWNGSRDSPSLTGSAGGLGSTLSGSHAVVRRS